MGSELDFRIIHFACVVIKFQSQLRLRNFRNHFSVFCCQTISGWTPLLDLWCLMHFWWNLLPDLESRLTAYLMHNEIQYWSAFVLSGGSIEKFMGFQIYCAFQTWNRRVWCCIENSVWNSLRSLIKHLSASICGSDATERRVWCNICASVISASFFHSNGWTRRKKTLDGLFCL